MADGGMEGRAVGSTPSRESARDTRERERDRDSRERDRDSRERSARLGDADSRAKVNGCEAADMVKSFKPLGSI